MRGRSTSVAGPPGFSMVELLVAMTLFLVVLGVAFTAFGSARKAMATESSGLETQQAARITLDEMALSIQQIGYGILRPDTTNSASWQRAVVYAGSHAFSFNADISPAIGPISSSTTITFPDSSSYAGEGPGSTTNGAETYLYTLDATGDDAITQSDRSGAQSGVFNPAAETPNPLDYPVFRKVYGYDGSGYGGTPLGVTGYLYTNATASDTYPDGSSPAQLFVYTLTEDLNADGLLDNTECIVLPCPPTATRAPKTYVWGDTDFNGTLSESEKTALRTLRVGSPSWSKNRFASGGSYFSTTLSVAVDPSGGAVFTLKVSDASQFGVGRHIQLGTGSSADRLIVTSVNTGVTPHTLSLGASPTHAHASGETIVTLDQTFLRAIRSVTILFDAITPREDVDTSTGEAAIGRAGRVGTRGLGYRVRSFERRIDLVNLRAGA